MRAAILGCRHKGDCGAGFMQVNSGSSCGKAFYNSNSTYIESNNLNLLAHTYIVYVTSN